MTDIFDPDWHLVYSGWNPEEQKLRETLTCLGNGYFATRGAFEEANDIIQSYPGTYLAGCFNRVETQLNEQLIETEDMVNLPNWLPIQFKVEDEKWFNLQDVNIKEYAQVLDLKSGVLIREVEYEDKAKRIFHLQVKRLIHIKHFHLGCTMWSLTSRNWSGKLTIRSIIDANVSNSGVQRYQALNHQHLETITAKHIGDELCELITRTNQSHITIAMALKNRIADGFNQPFKRIREVQDNSIGHLFEVECRENDPITLEKTLAIYSSKDHAISEVSNQVRQEIIRAKSFTDLERSQKESWDRLWFRNDIQLDKSDHHIQLILRLHIFHLNQVASPNIIDLDVGVPARGLHGEAYRGHIFWDELFVFPFFNLRSPELTRSFLIYRYRRLNEARYHAKQSGFEGALFPWQSGSDGREESQLTHLNPLSGHWVDDNTYLQRHINSAIAYNIWQYFQITADHEFLSYYGIEMLLEIARFWASAATWDEHHKRYSINHVVGPDEYHTINPKTKEPGLKNNAYTNVMASWALTKALEVLKLIPEARHIEILNSLNISSEELIRWDHISRKLYVPFLSNGIIAQFEGWDSLKELHWDELKVKYEDIQRIDRILEAEDLDCNNFKACKQADAIMLLYLFSNKELATIFKRLNYHWHSSFIKKNIAYYTKRTSHGSTLSRVVYAWVLSRSDRERSWSLFKQALLSDMHDIQNGTSSEGIHLGAMAGTVDLIQRCYGGIEIRDDRLWFDPKLPNGLYQISFFIKFRSQWIYVEINHHELRLSVECGYKIPIRIDVLGHKFTLHENERKTFPLSNDETYKEASN